MEEIANNIYLEGSYPGVVLAAFNFRHGVIMVDAPFRSEDLKSWRASLLNLGGGVDKILVMLDTHIDRTLGVKGMDATVLGQENSVQILKSRPTSARSQPIDAGSDWESFDLPANIRWVVPHMTYSESVSIYWDEDPIVLTHQPGAHAAASWLRFDAGKLLMVGDSVVLDQPPFLSWSDIPTWLEELKWLQSDAFEGYTIINGRNGQIDQRSIGKMVAFLKNVQASLDQIAAKNGSTEDAVALTPDLLKGLPMAKLYADLYENRLRWGLEQYYERHYLMKDDDKTGES